MQFRAEEIARLTRGSLVGPDVVVDGASIDSRSVRAGQLFVPVRAARDGHAFIDAALANGAGAYLTERAAQGGTAIEVADAVAALTRLGACARDRLPDAVIGVTGSVGKTTVKDLLSSVLRTTYRAAASERNFNNELGVPLALLGAPDGTEVFVQELGARGIGHIDQLCRVARPTTAVVTVVAEVHTSEFGGLDEVARAKSELVAAIPADGYVVLNDNDARVRAMARHADGEVITFGVSGDVVAEKVAVDDLVRPRFRLRSPWGSADVELRVHGVHQVANALAAAAAALVHDVPVDAVAAGLGAAELSPWRMQLVRAPSGAVIINDAYNASPTSVTAALHSLAALDADRHVAVLGHMAELGASSDDRHRAIGELADDLDIEVIAVAAPEYDTGLDVPDAASALDALGTVGDGVAVLVKASRSAGLEVVADALIR